MPPRVIAFDIIETVFPIEPLRPAFVEKGLPGQALELWFARALRDGFALAATDSYVPFRTLLFEGLCGFLRDAGHASAESAAAELLAGMGALSPRAEARAAFEAARHSGAGLVALSNGSQAATESLLQQAGLLGLVDRVVSVDEVRCFKPRREVYRHAASVTDHPPESLALVAIHPWDLHGAKRAGFATGFLTAGEPFPESMAAPDVRGGTLTEVVEQLVART